MLAELGHAGASRASRAMNGRPVRVVDPELTCQVKEGFPIERLLPHRRRRDPAPDRDRPRPEAPRRAGRSEPGSARRRATAGRLCPGARDAGRSAPPAAAAASEALRERGE